MSARRLCALVVGLAALQTAPAAAAPPKSFDARVNALLGSYPTPGLAIAIVEDGKVTLARGYGVRRLGAPDKVDADTIFPTASTGKAFTVAALATLVDAGRLKWDDRVIDHLPDFQMYDPWVTREITLRDLLVHRSGLGLGAGDLLFVPSTNLSRKESVRRLRYIKPATSFRSGYAYDNVLYMVAGQLIEEVSGQTWEDYVRDHVLKPAGMSASTTRDADRFRNPDRAQPHARLNGAIRGLGDPEVLDERRSLGDNAAPAGGLAVSAADMSRWLRIQLARGRLPDGTGRLFSEEAAKEMWTPQVLQPITPRPAELKEAEPQFLTYALGWEVRDWRGHKIVWHAGGDIGYGAVVVLIPEKNVGFSILMNAEDGETIMGLMDELLDHYLGFPATDWPSRLAAYKRKQAAAAVAALRTAGPQDAARTAGPSLPVERYAGDYRDPWYGVVQIRRETAGLVIDFRQSPGMVGSLEHVRHDTFRTVWADRSIEPAYVTFGLSAEGEAERITMKPVSPLADFSYDYQDLDLRRTAPETPSAP